MSSYLFLPLAMLKFWYIESPQTLWGFFGSLNHAFFQLFSLPLLLKTFFKPLKNEYREGLVGFSIAMGMLTKSLMIIVDTLMLVILLTIEVIIFLAFLAFPLMTVIMLFL